MTTMKRAAAQPVRRMKASTSSRSLISYTPHTISLSSCGSRRLSSTQDDDPFTVSYTIKYFICILELALCLFDRVCWDFSLPVIMVSMEVALRHHTDRWVCACSQPADDTDWGNLHCFLWSRFNLFSVRKNNKTSAKLFARTEPQIEWQINVYLKSNHSLYSGCWFILVNCRQLFMISWDVFVQTSWWCLADFLHGKWTSD